ncbi:hypothetical protein DPM35_27025 [Mesorhizobium atlanticum]|uniref:SDR family NAD(P)-dependent oxidoreductase n=1 Tax=Mesorhizobium atlanticum TaxID=2233532 RepID=A0A330GUJ8_9HYPH|nr:hypothetical protein DPM35_27025 [Mesorhizobium atlanticum]
MTGAAGGIGQAIARQFVANGYRVVSGGADLADLDRLEAELNLTHCLGAGSATSATRAIARN